MATNHDLTGAPEGTKQYEGVQRFTDGAYTVSPWTVDLALQALHVPKAADENTKVAAAMWAEQFLRLPPGALEVLRAAGLLRVGNVIPWTGDAALAVADVTRDGPRDKQVAQLRDAIDAGWLPGAAVKTLIDDGWDELSD